MVNPAENTAAACSSSIKYGSSSGASSSSSSSSWSVIKFLDDNIRYIKYPFFVVGCVGVFVIARSIKLGKKFVSANTIPKEFYKKNFSLYGKVEEVKKFDGTEQSIVLFVDHEPIFTRRNRTMITTVPKTKTDIIKSCLQITVPGVSLKSKYFPELHKKLISQRVAFTLMEADVNMNSATCLLFVKTIKFKIIPRYENIGFWCVHNGYAATVAIPYPSDLRESKKFGVYYAKLLEIERKAAEKRKGIWKDDDDDDLKSRNWITKGFKWLIKMWRSR